MARFQVSQADEEAEPRTIALRRVIFWFESCAAACLALLGAFFVSIGFLFRDRDPHHGGAYPILFGAFILVSAGTLGFAALCLRGRSRLAYLPQAVPLAILAWIVWDILSHAG